MFLMSSSHTSNVEESIKLCRGVLEKHEGQVLVIKKWDERKLSYEIGKAKRGLYIIAYFKAPAAVITTLERDVRLSEDYTRVLITRADHLSIEEMEAVEPQPIAPPAPERQPWDSPDFGMGMGGGDRGGDRGAGGDKGAGGAAGARPPRAPRRREDAGAAAEAAVGKE